MWGRYALWGDALAPHEDPGGVVLISQSGNVAVNALATRRGLRFHTVIASGNQAVLSAADFLAFVAGVDDVASVALYLEDDGDPSLVRCAGGVRRWRGARRCAEGRDLRGGGPGGGGAQRGADR